MKFSNLLPLSPLCASVLLMAVFKHLCKSNFLRSAMLSVWQSSVSMFVSSAPVRHALLWQLAGRFYECGFGVGWIVTVSKKVLILFPWQIEKKGAYYRYKKTHRLLFRVTESKDSVKSRQPPDMERCQVERVHCLLAVRTIRGFGFDIPGPLIADFLFF